MKEIKIFIASSSELEQERIALKDWVNNTSNDLHKYNLHLKPELWELKSREFVRIRVGITPTKPSGKLKKPKGEKDVIKFILGEFKKSELETLKKLSKKVAEAVETIFSESKEKAMSLYN